MTPARHVLVIDDSPGVRVALRTMLGEHDLEVVEADGGEAGIALLDARDDIGLVFLDMNMPGLSGLEALDRIRGDARHANLPVVILTGEGPTPAARSARELGVVGWLQKPVRMESLIAVARHYLGDG